MQFSVSYIALALALTLTVLANAVSADLSNHGSNFHLGAVARRARQGKAGDLHKRQGGSGRATFYDPSTGPGHCGRTFQKNDPIVAVNSAQFKLSDCFKWITVTANGQTHSAQITDSCPGCPMGALDFSPGFFSQFASLDDGIFQMSWSMGGGGGNNNNQQQQQQKPKTSSTPKPTPARTSSTPRPTPTKQSTTSSSSSSSQTPTSTSSSTSSSSSSTSSTSSTSTSASTSATSTDAATTPVLANNLHVLNQAVNGFLAMAKAQQAKQTAL